MPYIILFLFNSSLKAQNFRTLNSKRISIYTTENLQKTYEYIGLQFDSVKVINKDTILFPYSTINNSNPYCLVFDTSWVGRKINSKENGDDIYYTGKGDSIIIKTKAKLNDHWRWRSKSGMIDIQVTGTSTEQILGITDSVKTMKLRFISNNNVVSTFDSIKISKNFGLVRFYSMVNFPSVKKPIVLKGIDKIGGIQNLTTDKIFDFNVGDIFDRVGGYRHGVSHSEENFRDTILEKRVTADSVIYKISKFYTIKESGPFVTDNSLRIYHTVKYVKYPLHSNQDTIINSMPLKSFPIYGYSFNKYIHENFIPGLDSKITFFDGFVKEMSTLCIKPGIDMLERNEYAAGLGNINYYGKEGSVEKKMVYYKKGNKTWGTAIDFDKITGSNPPTHEDFSLVIKPYPLKDDGNMTIVSPSNQNFKIEVFSLTGELIKSYQTPAMTPIPINKSDFHSGFFLIKTIDNNGRSFTRKMIVEN